MSDQQRGLGSRQDVTAVPRPPTGATTRGERADETAGIPVVRDEPGAGASAKDAGAAPASKPAAASSGAREARLRLVRVDPWSVTKTAFTLSVALMIVAVVAMTVLWSVLSIAGVWDQINSTVTAVLSDDSGSFDIKDYLGFGRLVGLTLVISAINVLITTAVTAIAAHLYNLAAQLLGGVTVTLAEDA